MIMITVETTILDQLLDPLKATMSPDQAKQILALRASPVTQARLDWLAAQNAENRLSEAEQAEYSSLVYTGAVISLFQAKARRQLNGAVSD